MMNPYQYFTMDVCQFVFDLTAAVCWCRLLRFYCCCTGRLGIVELVPFAY